MAESKVYVCLRLALQVKAMKARADEAEQKLSDKLASLTNEEKAEYESHIKALASTKSKK